jgi:hypothetical protein
MVTPVWRETISTPEQMFSQARTWVSAGKMQLRNSLNLLESLDLHLIKSVFQLTFEHAENGRALRWTGHLNGSLDLQDAESEIG